MWDNRLGGTRPSMQYTFSKMWKAVLGALVVGQCWVANPASAASKHRPEERMDVADVLAAGDGQFVVVLRTASKPVRYLPIWVGENDAVALKMRLDRRAPPRPLTLNLLEQVLRQTNVKVLEIAIDDYKDGMFLGKIKLKQNGRSWELEARPSDAIALAMGRHLPVLVARDIVDGAGFDPSAMPGAAPKSEGQGGDAAGAAGMDASALDETL